MGKFTPSRSNVNDLEINGTTTYTQGPDLTVTNGTVTVTHTYHRLQSQGGVAADDLNRIEGAEAADVGQILILAKKPGSGAVNVIDNVDGDSSGANIIVPANRELGNDKDTIILVWHGSRWLELSFANNG